MLLHHVRITQRRFLLLRRKQDLPLGLTRSELEKQIEFFAKVDDEWIDGVWVMETVEGQSGMHGWVVDLEPGSALEMWFGEDGGAKDARDESAIEQFADAVGGDEVEEDEFEDGVVVDVESLRLCAEVGDVGARCVGARVGDGKGLVVDLMCGSERKRD